MILADTSVWIDHLRRGDKALGALLQKGNVLMHTMVRGELACGGLRDRTLILRLWQNLPALPAVTDEAAMAFMEARSLMGKGIGFIDVHLLSSVAAQQGARLWTRDKRLAALAQELKLAWKEEAS